MTRKATRSLVLSFLISLVVFASGCMWSPISWSPDSSKVVFLTIAKDKDEEDDGGEVMQVWSGDVATEKCTKLYETRNALGAPAWSPDGKRVALFEGVEDIEEHSARFILLEPGNPPKKYSMPGIAGQFEKESLNRAAASWRPDGKAVALNLVTDERMGVVVADLDTGKVIRRKDGVSFCSWSPDGKWLAGLAVKQQDDEENEEEKDDEFTVVLLSAEDWTLKNLHTFAGGPALGPVWSPDGRSLCMSGPPGEEDEGAAVWMIDVATGKAKLLAPQGETVGVSWSPDGKQIVYCFDHGNEEDDPDLSDIVSMDPATGHRKVLVSGGRAQPENMTPAWSPGGRWIAYRSVIGGDGVLFLVRLVSRDGARHKTLYTSDGQMLALAEWLIEGAQEGEADQQAICREEAEKVLRDIPRRFPDTKLAPKIRELEKQLEAREKRMD